MKKKVNPNRVPVSVKNIDISAITRQASDGMVLRAWALVLASLAGFYETKREDMLLIWEKANSYATRIKKYEDVEAELIEIERIAGVKLPYEKLSPSSIRTQGDLERFIRRTESNAISSAFAIIAEPIIRAKLMDEDMIRRVFQKADSMNEELSQKNISIHDIQEMLLEEYGLLLEDSDQGTQLKLVSAEQ